MKLNNKGFAISSIMYIILIISALIIALTLAILSGRKLILDNLKKEVLINITEKKESSGETGGESGGETEGDPEEEPSVTKTFCDIPMDQQLSTGDIVYCDGVLTFYVIEDDGTTITLLYQNVLTDLGRVSYENISNVNEYNNTINGVTIHEDIVRATHISDSMSYDYRFLNERDLNKLGCTYDSTYSKYTCPQNWINKNANGDTITYWTEIYGDYVFYCIEADMATMECTYGEDYETYYFVNYDSQIVKVPIYDENAIRPVIIINKENLVITEN